MPWAGTSKGAASIVKTFVDVARYWRIEAFETEGSSGRMNSPRCSAGSRIDLPFSTRS
jgi:hypothetical protein